MKDAPLRILFFGAGALGTLYATRLGRCGHAVSILARGARLDAIQTDGLRIRSRRRARVDTLVPSTISTLESTSAYDLIIVLVRRPQVDEALAAIAAGGAGDVLVMVNDARGYVAWRSLLGRRLIVGFAGAIASFDGGTVVYDIVPGMLQPTVLGEPDGRPSARVDRIARALREAGFPVRVRADMEAWQRSHAAWITPFMLTATASARQGGPISADLLRTWVLATQETLTSVARATPLAPRALGRVPSLPVGLLTLFLRVALASPSLRRAVVASGAASSDEARALARDLVALAARYGNTLPHLQALVAASDPGEEARRAP